MIILQKLLPNSNRYLRIKVFLLTGYLLFAGCASNPVLLDGKPKHHTKKGFRNYPPVPTASSKSFSFYMRRVWDSFFLPEVPLTHYLTEEEAIVQLNKLKDENTITWLGQATFLLRINGKTILTDPFLTEYTTSFKIGPKRFVPPGITIKNLPKIDIIIISHDHYDHLHAETIELLPGKEAIHVFVPLGLKAFFTERGYPNVQELDWNESSSFSDIQLEALPAVHNSGQNKTLWCSWAIIYPSGKLFFSGDTAYSPIIFREIGNKYGLFDLAMVPIGAYEPRDFLWMSHTTPEEAIGVGLDIKADVLVGMHWGTIKLSDESPWEPTQRFGESAQLLGISKKRIWVLKIGETRPLPIKLK